MCRCRYSFFASGQCHIFLAAAATWPRRANFVACTVIGLATRVCACEYWRAHDTSRRMHHTCCGCPTCAVCRAGCVCRACSHHGYLRNDWLDTNSIIFITFDFCMKNQEKKMYLAVLHLDTHGGMPFEPRKLCMLCMPCMLCIRCMLCMLCMLRILCMLCMPCMTCMLCILCMLCMPRMLCMSCMLCMPCMLCMLRPAKG